MAPDPGRSPCRAKLFSPETVIQHLKVSRERYGVHCGQSLIISALFDGLIGFRDIFRTRDVQ